MLGDFLMELDGPKHRGRRVGSFDWRYYLIENPRSETLPYVSIEFLHEVVFGVLCVAEDAVGGGDDARATKRTAGGSGAPGSATRCDGLRRG